MFLDNKYRQSNKGYPFLNELELDICVEKRDKSLRESQYNSHQHFSLVQSSQNLKWLPKKIRKVLNLLKRNILLQIKL